jgi:hypothetical protein
MSHDEISHWGTFDKDLKRISKKYKTFPNDLSYSKKILFEKFVNNKDFSVSNKVHRVTSLSETSRIEIWKIEALCKGYRPNLWPRIWFLLNEDSIILLVARIHSDNYDNNKVDREAVEIAEDIICS